MKRENADAIAHDHVRSFEDVIARVDVIDLEEIICNMRMLLFENRLKFVM